MNVKKEEKKEEDDKKNVCYKSLFYWRKRVEKVSGSSAHLGIFMYLKTALGLRKKIGRCIFVFCCIFYIT